MLGVLDWGIGGISILKLIREQNPGKGLIYFSDTGAEPYGKMSRRDLAARLDVVIGFLHEQGLTHLVIGCNAASTAIGDLQDHGVPIEGVIEGAVDASVSLRPASLGLIGGRRTVVSGIYKRKFEERGVAVKQRVAQPLSALIESGDIGSEHLKQTASTILRPLRNCSHILLACTHYPAVTDVLGECVSPHTKFIDPAAATVKRIGRWKPPGGGEDKVFTTGNAAQMKVSARRAFGVDLQGIRKVRLG